MAKDPKDFWLEGLVPAVFTPFDKNGELELSKIEPYCEYLLKNNIKAVYINGTTGEGKSLTKPEREIILEKWIKVSKGRLKIVAHVGVLNVRESKELAKHADESGADAIATLPPLFFKPQSTDTLIEHCKAIADVAPHLPFYYYHLPSMTGVEFNMEDFMSKAQGVIPNLVGIKFSSKDLVDMIGCVFKGKVNVLYGCDEQLLAGLVTGAHGAVGSTHNFMPLVFQRMIENVKNGELQKAREEQMCGQRLCRIMYKYGALLGGNVAALKSFMPLVGLDLGPPREPMRAMTGDEKKQFEKEVKNLGFFSWSAAVTS
ncbi:N-acetylneuraminate lyase B-like [Ostrea edulis]|uniref:N-acetylneuraminate lyase B-like n=1 Tax=Ostrea edulis TaxID=37623 RepID=UPI0024AE8AB6|nr:N-acetylneuraminate lyase B-like [Ostrea edulis]